MIMKMRMVFFNKTKQNSTNRENGLAAYLSVCIYVWESCVKSVLLSSVQACPSLYALSYAYACWIHSCTWIYIQGFVFFLILPCCSIAQLHRTVRKSGYANLSIPFSLACLSVRGLPPRPSYKILRPSWRLTTSRCGKTFFSLSPFVSRAGRLLHYWVACLRVSSFTYKTANNNQNHENT